jgi:hypothetical protein
LITRQIEGPGVAEGMGSVAFWCITNNNQINTEGPNERLIYEQVCRKAAESI